MPTSEEYRALGVGKCCPQCEAVRAAIIANESPDAEYKANPDVGTLLIKHGKFGEFIACSLRCGYTRSVPGRSFYPEPKKKGICKTCSGTGYVPFIKPDKSISKYAQLTCPDCGGYDHERDYADANMPDRVPSDFDFGCSETWRGFYNGERNQQVSPPAEKPETLNDRRWDSIQQLRAQVRWLSKKVTERRIERKKTDNNYEPF